MGISAGGLNDVDSIHSIGSTMRIAPSASTVCAPTRSPHAAAPFKPDRLAGRRIYASSPRTAPNWISVTPITINVRMTASADAYPMWK